PTASNDSYRTVAQTPLTIAAPGVLTNDTDAESAALTAQPMSSPAHGSLTLNSDGSFTYTPAANFAGADSFTYRASDGVNPSTTATVVITVVPTACVPRPQVQASPSAGGGKLLVHVEATPLSTLQNNPFQALRFGTFQNAKVTLNGQAIASGQTYT